MPRDNSRTSTTTAPRKPQQAPEQPGGALAEALRRAREKSGNAGKA
jgi:hypothetical protein